MEPRGTELITIYKHNYRIPSAAEVTEDMILNHWELEKNLTKDLLESTPENRWEVFEKAYTTLYSSLDWLNSFSVDSTPPLNKYETWLGILGSPPKKIYEVGSGKGEMIAYFAKCGFECKATEITKERGSKHITDSSSNLSWGNSDGVHLDQFEPTAFYDFVVSNQVVEHFHPNDLITHFQSVYQILNQQGSYIFTTPHCHTGPHDLSLVFGYDDPQCMHLKEYTYHELQQSLKVAGFKRIYSAVPAKLKKLLSTLGLGNEKQIKTIGIFYFHLMLMVENLLFVIPSKKQRRAFSKFLRKIYLFADNIFLVAQK
ncbi:putative methyltransferase [Calothrix sp. NIES-2100]|uniref:class I SAM-dependent methyltransferase n=1 Tax=Calothrix sp. NIES-2100 TaxID=1954172 RepID=UPI000B5E866C|nr:putative methyltransferase [Calothrix sp. NIES-2100]